MDSHCTSHGPMNVMMFSWVAMKSGIELGLPGSVSQKDLRDLCTCSLDMGKHYLYVHLLDNHGEL
jgi:hypothetical protein